MTHPAKGLSYWGTSIILILTLSVPAWALRAGSTIATMPTTGHEYVQGELIIKYADGVSERNRSAFRATVSAASVRTLRSIGAEVLQISGMSVPDALQIMQDDPRIEYAEPNYFYYADVIPNDPEFDRLWGMHNTGQTGGTPEADISATDAWLVGTGDSVIIGVIDTGVDTAHADLRANIWTNPGEIPNNGVDDDGNGYVDDVHGWDFVNNDNGPIDDYGHGTHCAGTIAGVGDNGIGVAGVCWAARIMPLKFIASDGYGTTEDAILAVEYATMMGARLTSNSWGGGAFSEALRDAIDSAGAHGILFVASAGNNYVDTDLQPHYPSSYDLPNLISVTATDYRDNHYYNWGLTSVDLGAPGRSVYSTIPGNQYTHYNGTSMATPHVSGAIGLAWSLYPYLTHLQMKDRIMATVDTLPSLAGKCVTGGRLNVFHAVSDPDSTAPGVILDLAVVLEEGGRITLSWTATGDDSTSGKAAYYDVRYSLSPIDSAGFESATQADGEPNPQLAGSPESFMITVLDFTTTYHFAVKAFDEWHNASPVSNSPAGTTLAPPVAQLSPMELVDTLFINGTSTQQLTLANQGEGELLYSVDVDYPGVQQAQGSITIPPPTEDVQAGMPPELGAMPPHRTTGEIAFDITGESLATVERDILLVYADVGASALKTILAQYPDIGTVDTWFAGPSLDSVPTFDDVAGYDVLIAWRYPFSQWDDAVAIGDLLADFIDSGGVVLTTSGCWQSSGSGSRGRYFDSAGYSPFKSILGSVPSPHALGWHETHHPIMAGVSALADDWVTDMVMLAEGSRYVALWDDGTPLVATNPGTVAINVWPGDGYYWTGDFPTLIHNAINYATRGVYWLSVSPTEGEVAPYSDSTLQVSLDAAGLAAGDHATTIQVFTNDPSSPLITAAVTLHILGAPNIALHQDSLDFGSILIGYPQSLPLRVANDGDDSLTVTAVSASAPEFAGAPGVFTLAPGADLLVTVIFDPLTAGEITGTLTIESNDPDAPATTVVVRGEGLIPPVISTTTTELSGSLVYGDSSIQIVTISNTGGSDLTIEMWTEGTGPARVAVVTEYHTEAENARDMLYASGQFDSVGIVLTQDLTPETLDAYDGLLVWSLGGDMDGHGNALADFVDAGGGVVCALYEVANTLICPWWWGCYDTPVLSGRWSAQQYFVIERSMSVYSPYADLGFVSVPDHPIMAGVSEVGGDYDRSRPGTAALTPGATLIASWSDGMPLAAFKPLGRARRVDLGLHPGYQHPSGGQLLISNALRWAARPIWVYAHPQEATIPAGGSLDLAITFNASKTYGGTYDGLLNIVSNDPATPEVTIPAQLVVTGVPEVAVSDTALEFGSAFIGDTVTRTITVLSEGTADLTVSGTAVDLPEYSVSPAGFTIAPGQSQPLVVTFVPPSAATFTATLTISTDDPDEPEVNIELTGEGLVPPVVSSAIDSWYDSLITGTMSPHPIQIDNLGGSDLNWYLRGEVPRAADRLYTLTSPIPGLDSRAGAVQSQAASGSGIEVALHDLTGVRILYDQSHGQIDTNSFTTIISDLTLRGATVEVCHDSITPGRLTDIDVLWILDRNTYWRPGELNAVKSWAIGGGGLLLTGEGSVSVLNPILSTLGAGIVFSSTNAAGGISTEIYPHEMTRDVGSVYLSPSAHLSVVSSPARRLILNQLEVPVAAYSEVGAGRILAIADDDMLVDGQIGREDNQLFDNQAFGWLARAIDWLRFDPPYGTTPAGSSSVVTATVDAARMEGGAYAADIHLTSNDPLTPEVAGATYLQVTGAADIVLSDTALDFGGVFVGMTAEDTLVITNHGVYPLMVGSVALDGSAFGADTSWILLSPDVSYSLAVTFAPTEEAPATGSLTFTSDDPDEPVVIVALRGEGIFSPIVSVSPDSVYEQVPMGDSSSRTLTIANAGGSDLIFELSIGAQPVAAPTTGTRSEVHAATATKSGVASVHADVDTAFLRTNITSGVVPAGATTDVELTFDATGLVAGPFWASILLTCNDPGTPELTVPITLRVTGTPDIALSDSAVDFGALFVGSTITDTVLVTNEGTDSLTVSSVTSDHADYSANMTTFSLSLGESQSVEITFAPSTPDTVRGTLTFASDDPDEPNVTVALQGIGLPPPVIRLSRDSLSDTLFAGTHRTDTVTVTNDGLSDLEFDVTIENPRGLTVAVLASGPQIWLDDVYAKLETRDEFRSVGLLDAQFSTPTLPELSDYDAILIWSVTPFDDPATLGDNLADYADGGGGVICALFEAAGATSQRLAGRWESEAYHVLVRGDERTGSATLGTVHDPEHPTMRGVISFDGGPRSHRPRSFDVVDSATVIASWSDGTPLVAVRHIGTARRVDLGFLPPSSDVYSDFWRSDTDGDLLMVNSLLWATGVPFLSVHPTAGIVSPSSSVDIEVELSAVGIHAGRYSADLVFASNDPLSPLAPVAVELQVLGEPEISINRDTVNLDPVFVGLSIMDSLLIFNIGTDTLFVAGITTGRPEYLTDTAGFPLPPGRDRYVHVACVPIAPGMIADTLTITSNDPTHLVAHVVLITLALEPPDIAVAPDSLTDTLVVGASSVQPMTITNTGAHNLVFSIQARHSERPPPSNTTDRVTADALGIQFYEGFEDGDYDGWSDGGGEGVKEVTDATAAVGSRSFHYYYTGARGHNHGIYKDFPAGSQPTYISFHVRVPSTVKRAAYFVLTTSNGSKVVWFYAETDGTFYINRPSNQFPNSFTYVPGQWHFVELKDIDWTAKRFDYYVDGELIVARVALRNPDRVNDIGRLHLYNFDADSEAWWDAIQIGKGEYVSVVPDTGVVPAGASTTLDVTFDADGVTGGDYHSDLLIFTNVPDKSLVAVSIDLHVFSAPNIVVTPDTLGFVTTYVGWPSTAWMTIHNIGDDLLTVTDIQSDNPAFRVDTTTYEIVGAAYHIIPVSFDPAVAGPVTGTLTMFSDDPDEPATSITLVGEGAYAPIMMVTPDSLNDTLLAGDSTSRIMTLANIGQSELWFVSQANPSAAAVLEGQDDESDPTAAEDAQGYRADQSGRGASASWLTVSPLTDTIQVDSTLDLVVSLNASALIKGTYQGNIRLLTNVPGLQITQYPVILEVTGEPAITVADSVIDFGSLFVGAIATQGLLVTNPGSDQLVCTLAVNHPDYSTPVSELTLDPGVGATVGIEFMPQSPGSISALLTIATNVPGQPSVTVDLQGEALEPPVLAPSADSLAADLDVGDTATQILTIANTGANDLTVALVAGGGFSLLATGLSPRGATALVAASAPSGLYHDDGLERIARRIEHLVQTPLAWADYAVAARAGGRTPTAAGTDALDFDLPVAVTDSLGDADVPDVVSLRALSYGDRLYVELEFAGNVPRNRLGGFLSLDIDQNPGTGVLPSFGQPGQILGAEYEIRLFRTEFSQVRLYDAVTGWYVTSASVQFNGPIMSFSIPLSYMSPSDGVMDVTGVVGSSSEPTDWFPESGSGWIQAAGRVTTNPGSGTVPPGGQLEVAVHFNSLGLLGGEYGTSILLSSNDPLALVDTIPVTLSLTGIPAIELDVDSIDFGEVHVNFSGSLELHVTNRGTDVLTITDVVLSVPEFSVDSSTFTLAPNAGTVIPVVFTPSASGPLVGTLTIHSDDPVQNAIPVTLLGHGVHAPSLTSAPDTLSFQLLQGTSTTGTFRLGNEGIGELNFGVSFAHFSAGQPSVLLLAADSDNRVLDVGAKLAALQRFSAVTTYRADEGTPDLEVLQASDAVLLWSRYPYSDRTLLGNVLADYVDGGGGVVCGVYEAAGSVGTQMGGRWDGEAYYLVERSSTYRGRYDTLGTVFGPGHPTMRGVETFNGGYYSYCPDTTGLAPGAQLIASWSHGRPLVVVERIGETKRVDLGFYPPYVSTGGDLLMANALDWVARSSWLSADVTYGVLQTGDSVVITLTLDAAALVAGLHTTDIVIENNDPGHVGFVIPLKLEIVPIEIGDVNADGAVNAADLIYLVQAIFHGAPEPPAWVADFNCDFSMTVADVVAMVNYIFKGAPAAECE